MLDRSDAGRSCSSAAPMPPTTCRASSPTTSRRSSPGEGCYAALLDRKGHMQADMRVLRLSRAARSGSTRRPWPPEPVRKHLETYKIGREVEVEDATADWAITSLIGPPPASVAGVRRLAPEHAQRDRRARRRSRSSRVATDQGLDLIARPTQPSRLRGQLVAAGRRRGERGGGGDHPGRVREAPLRPRDGRRDDARRGRHRRARGRLREGLLHRPGAGRPASLQGQAATGRCAACA